MGVNLEKSAIAFVGILLAGLAVAANTCVRNADSIGRTVSRASDDALRAGRSTADDVAGSAFHQSPGDIARRAVRANGLSLIPESEASHASATALGKKAKDSPRILAITATDEQTYAKMFPNEVYSTSTKQQLDDFARRIEAVAGEDAILRNAADAEQYIKSVLSEMKHNTLVVTGHSIEEGGERFLLLPNGKKIAASQLHRTAGEHGKSCVVLTCYSEDLSFTKRVSFRDAATLIERLESANVADSPDSVKAFLKSEFKALGLRSRLKVIVLGTGAGGGVYVAALDDRK